MSVLVGSARIDENGKASGGTAGDQTGKEVCTQAWYSKPWDYMAIHPDADVREKIAAAVEDACANDNIGYNQNKRNTLNTQAAKVSYELAKIVTTCECDCSSLQNVACIAGGAVEESSYGSNGWTTSTMKSALKSAGFVIITTSSYLTSEKYAVRGAIYVKSGSHTVAALGNGSSYKSTLEKAGVSTSTSSTSGSGTSSYALGDKVTLSKTPLYASATAKESSGTKSGTFYIWDATVTNGRIRITNKASNVGASGQVTGWVNVSDIGGTSTTSTASSGSTSTSTKSSDLDEDGEIGTKTTKRWQKVMGTTQDGTIDGQPSSGKKYWTSISSAVCKWSGGTSDVVKATQQFLLDKGYYYGLKKKFVDGLLGKNTAKALQKYLIAQGFSCGSAGVDGVFGTESAKAFQKWLNAQ